MSLIVYTDGANSLKNKVGGCAAIIINNNNIITELVQAYKGPNITNNSMELYAVLMSLEYIYNNLLEKDVTIISDSEYVVKGATIWLDKWKSKNWKTTNKNPVKNKVLWEAIDIFKSLLDIKFKWVRGHNNDKWNDRADELAVNAYKELLNDNNK